MNFQRLFGIVEPVEEALALLFLGDAQMEFQHHGSVAHEMPLEGADILEALLPDIFRDQPRRQFLLGENFRMHAHDQAFLVMRAVENPDPPARRHALRHAPEEIVIEFLGGRRLEGMHLAAHRIHAVEHVLDDAALAGCVHALQDHQHRPFVLRVKPLLQIGEMLGVLGDDLLGFVLADLEPAGIGRVET